jgi:hypothetical protein
VCESKVPSRKIFCANRIGSSAVFLGVLYRALVTSPAGVQRRLSSETRINRDVILARLSQATRILRLEV